ncbi:hypothetical protein [Actinomadura sp. 3N508]|uniref:hypothetical protein n=1 Tax=Actinomadura sp. 3N508 TaxID=3375153 RepID=UPI00379BB14E
MFHVRRGVLLPHQPPHQGELRFLCWPVLMYRVTAPVVRVRHLNILEKVVLAMCVAGVRQPSAIAGRIHQDVELCKYVLKQLRAAGRLDMANAPTDAGHETLRTTRLGEEPELIITHVLQDPVTGRLWPRSVDEPSYQQVQRDRGAQADLRLNTAGSPRKVTAHVVPGPPGAEATPPPTPQQIIDAVAAQRQAESRRRAAEFADARGGRSPAAHLAEQDLQALTTELTLPSDGAVHRVLDIGPPMPEYLLVWLREDDPAGGGPGWRAADPFGLDPNPMAQRLVTERMRDDPDVAGWVTGFADLSDERRNKAYRAKGQEVRSAAERRLVQLLGGEIRQRPQALKLLLGLEDAAARGGDSGVEDAAREAYRLYEYLFRLLAAEYPVPAAPSWDAGHRPPSIEVVKAALETAARDLGFDSLPPEFVKDGHAGKVRNYPKNVREGKEPVSIAHAYVVNLVPFLLVAAADQASPHRTDHPLRDLAGRRPALLGDLEELRMLRNRGSHAERDATVEDDIRWCRDLAMEAARIVVSVPQQAPERT